MAKDEDQDVARDQDGKPIVGYVGNQREPYVKRVEEEGLSSEDIDPTDRFVNVGTLGAGTIMPDGTYGPPMPDPNVKKLAEEAEELDLHGQDADQSPGIKSATPAKKTTPKAPEPTK
jgi:hypothetical protein